MNTPLREVHTELQLGQLPGLMSLLNEDDVVVAQKLFDVVDFPPADGVVRAQQPASIE